MRDSVAHGLEAALHRLQEFLARQLGDGVEDDVARPVVIVQQRLQVSEIHPADYDRAGLSMCGRSTPSAMNRGGRSRINGMLSTRRAIHGIDGARADSSAGARTRDCT